MTDTLEAIWNMLLEARDREWSGATALRRSLAAGDVALSAAGRWQADFTLDEPARTLLESLAPVATESRIVVAQLGQSLDGRIATRTGHSHYINGSPALTHLHRLRALVDAVIVGAGTACADQPRLSVRRVSGPDPVRVIIDPRGRVPGSAPLFDPAHNPGRIIHFLGPDADPEPPGDHIEHARLDLSPGGFAPSAIVSALADRGLRRILVEGGADTVSRFLDADALDRLHLLIAPLIIGSGRNGLELPAIDRLDEARRPRMRSYKLDDELLVDVDLGAGRN